LGRRTTTGKSLASLADGLSFVEYRHSAVLVLESVYKKKPKHMVSPVFGSELIPNPNRMRTEPPLRFGEFIFMWQNTQVSKIIGYTVILRETRPKKTRKSLKNLLAVDVNLRSTF
jgi:hypothetical protein